MPVHIDPADCIAFTKIHGEFVTSHWADVGIVPYGELQGVRYKAGRADRGVRPYASLGNPT